ncbi:MAG: XTP/dITP diphosphatase [Syntrophobacterales bacterium]|nr:MAG: XTP/dITP diphosphatase [Syntrophobacterales bacterium]
MELFLATRNEGKIREIRELLKGYDTSITSLRDYPNAPEVVENGEAYRDNVLKKARFFARWAGSLTLADDSGLEVDYLQGRPGVFSARYAGDGADDRENNRKLLRNLKGIPRKKRGAVFRCVMALVSPWGDEEVVEGECRGQIALEERGKRGFGYDPIFVIPRYGKTVAELSIAEKNRLSHRGKALRKLKKILKRYVGA